MTYVQDFILTSMEATAMILILDPLIKEKRDIKKYCFIIILTSMFTILTNSVSISVSNYFNYIFIIVLIIILFKKKIDEALMELGIVLAALMIIQLVIMAMIKLTKIVFVKDFYHGFTINSILIGLCIYINKFSPIGKIYNDNKSYIRKVYLFIINILFYILTAKFMWETNRKFFNESMLYISAISIGFLAFNIIFLVNNIKYERQKKVIETYNQYSPIMSNLIEDIKRRQHDFKNHLNTIYGIIQVTDDGEVKSKLKEYIESLRNSVQDSDNIVHVNNKIIAAIIYNKVCEAKDKNINFKYDVDNEADLGLKQHEISEVLNNLLDNAFEAAIKAENIRKNVELKIYIEEVNKIIEVRNSIPVNNISNMSNFFIRGFSTKEEKGHGYGLYNVKKIVEANKGIIQLSIEENIFIFRLAFS
ncbi:sensor histidine kinase [Clostridium omnivorum]|uniref:Histidine kinase/HSP90-like ATPase domain-containing protein n=1 Tax=Clostridium omnivorum TaxID=1604902 RepID=A0ABQ5N631_9CLOT|nr:GHKL domain-containing protein [Clostridium sp. E14]GLC30690.1 hypothetical protein bsdE14_21000 [Clostridium sp. E14]